MARRLAPGDIIGGFRLVQKFHGGGLGTLWKVSHDDITVPLLMKLPFLLPGDDPLGIVSYETEQMILPRLSSNHVPKFIAAGDYDGPYVVMEQIAGRSLIGRLTELPLPAEEVADLGARIADALEDLHRQRVVHLDLKPSNIMIRDGSGEVVLIDFGLARHLDLPDLLAEELEGPIGTGVYIAPEQLLGSRSDRRSDLYAWGCLVYLLLTGESPVQLAQDQGRRWALFQDEHFARLHAALNGVPGATLKTWADQLGIPSTALAVDWPGHLTLVMRQVLSPNPNRRPGTVAELRSWFVVLPPPAVSGMVALQLMAGEAKLLLDCSALETDLRLRIRRGRGAAPVNPE